jgi:hypothetical protein
LDCLQLDCMRLLQHGSIKRDSSCSWDPKILKVFFSLLGCQNKVELSKKDKTFLIRFANCVVLLQARQLGMDPTLLYSLQYGPSRILPKWFYLDPFRLPKFR